MNTSYPFRFLLFFMFVSVGLSVRGDDPNEKVRRMLKELRIPEIWFEEADVTDALQFLVTASRDADPERRGIRLFYKEPGPNDPLPGKISIRARNLSLEDALKFTTELVNLEYILVNGAVRVHPRSFREGMRRIYPSSDPSVLIARPGGGGDEVKASPDEGRANGQEAGLTRHKDEEDVTEGGEKQGE